MSKILLNVDKELKMRLKILAAKKDCTVSKLLIDAIKKMVSEDI